MSTPFQNVYNLFLNKISDYSFIGQSDDVIDSSLYNFLFSASAKFFYCKQDLSFTEDDSGDYSFNSDLVPIEQEILANLMILEWLEPMIFTTSLLRQTMTDRDFMMTSQANQLKQLQASKSVKESEIEVLMNRYSYQGFNGFGQSPPIPRGGFYVTDVGPI